MAGFKTAYLQAAFPVDVVVVGSVNEGTEVTKTNRKAAICVGDLVTLTVETGTVNGYISKAATLAAATHIVAQSDMTIGQGHAATDRRDYRYSPLVGATKATAPTDKTDALKHVALYPIWDKNDVLLDADGNDLATA